MDSKWLEFGLTGGLLVTVIVYILKVHIPSLVKTFSEGLTNIAQALREVHTLLSAVNAALASNRAEMAGQMASVRELVKSEVESCRTECTHCRERQTDRILEEIQDTGEKTRKLLED